MASTRPVEKLAIIGLDGAEPGLLLEHWLDDLPHLRSLVDSGISGRLESCIPPTTIPAWTCMATGKDPGTLGIYGFRDRRDWSYEDPGRATNLEVRQPRLWDLVGRASRPSIILGVPQTFPILHPPRGAQVTCFLTPSPTSPFTHPPELADEIQREFGPYIFDVDPSRTADKPALLEQLRRMTEQRFAVARHLAATRDWSLLWMVDMGLHGLHRAFWPLLDTDCPGYDAASSLAVAARDYAIFLDAQIGRLLDVLDRERTAIWVVSGHGAKRLDGGFCINDWLRRERLLVMKTPPRGPQRFDLASVDWSRTRAWGEGGHVGRIFVNRAGREPQGIVPADDYDDFCDDLARRLRALPGPDGQPLRNNVFKPEDVYDEMRGVPPDLVVHVDDLHYHAIDRIGHDKLFVAGMKDGADTANYALHGLHILAHPMLQPARRDASLYDVVPTSCRLLGLRAPRGIRGEPLV